MKRLNPKTGKPFKNGYIREDGKVFSGYRTSIAVKKNGLYVERWSTKEQFDKEAEIRKETTKKWRINNPSKVKAKSEEYYKNNFEILKAKSQEWRKKNPEKAKETNKAWRVINSEKLNANASKRRATKQQRTPLWLTKEHFEQISELFVIAKMFQMYTGEQYHVDHIVPLKGKNVSGLHVPWNLQVLPAKENIAKKNKHVQ